MIDEDEIVAKRYATFIKYWWGSPQFDLTETLRNALREATEAAAKKCDALAEELQLAHEAAYDEDRIDDEIECALKASAYRNAAAAIRGKP